MGNECLFLLGPTRVELNPFSNLNAILLSSSWNLEYNRVCHLRSFVISQSERGNRRFCAKFHDVAVENFCS